MRIAEDQTPMHPYLPTGWIALEPPLCIEVRLPNTAFQLEPRDGALLVDPKQAHRAPASRAWSAEFFEQVWAEVKGFERLPPLNSPDESSRAIPETVDVVSRSERSSQRI